jgi:hypothetical protein
MKKFSDLKRPTKIKKIFEQESKPEETNTPAEKSEKTGCAKLFSKLFESREMAHIYHLQVRGDEGSYAAHVALGAYYEGVLELVDEIIETYQGQYGLVEGYEIIDTAETKTKEKIEYFEDLAKFIKEERKCISEEDTHLHNIIDEVVALVYKTLYKLKFNK